jgi:hypothetical protein
MMVEFMVGQLLVTTKRSTQAGEILRKLQIKTINRDKKSYI